MQKVKLPLTVDPVKDAQQRIDYDGYYTASQLVRLAESTGKVLSDAQVTLSFYIDPQKLVVMKGQVQVDGRIRLSNVVVNHSNKHWSVIFMYSPVANWDQADDLPEIYEPIEFNEFGEIDLLGAVEDELILALPLVPMHSSEHCEVSAHEQVFGELPEELAKNRTRSLY